MTENTAVAANTAAQKPTAKQSSHLLEKAMKALFFLCACVSVAAVIVICIFMFAKGCPAIAKIGVGNFLFGTDWSPRNVPASYGIFPMIVGSLYCTAGAIIIGVPIGLLTAIFMAKFCPKKLFKWLMPPINLLQIDFLLELFQKAKERGINTTLDTCGNPFTREEPFFSKFQELMKVTDLVMLDIKHIDDEQHKILTGQTNKNILDMARYLSDTGKPVWIRHVLVPERSDKDEYLHRLHDFIETLDNVEKVEVLPYHTLGVYKWKELGIPYQLEGIDPPSKERVENANRILETAKYHA